MWWWRWWWFPTSSVNIFTLKSNKYYIQRVVVNYYFCLRTARLVLHTAQYLYRFSFNVALSGRRNCFFFLSLSLSVQFWIRTKRAASWRNKKAKNNFLKSFSLCFFPHKRVGLPSLALLFNLVFPLSLSIFDRLLSRLEKKNFASLIASKALNAVHENKKQKKKRKYLL